MHSAGLQRLKLASCIVAMDVNQNLSNCCVPATGWISKIGNNRIVSARQAWDKTAVEQLCPEAGLSDRLLTVLQKNCLLMKVSAGCSTQTPEANLANFPFSAVSELDLPVWFFRDAMSPIESTVEM